MRSAGRLDRTRAEAELTLLLAPKQHATPQVQAVTKPTFRDTSAAWLAYCENVRDCKPSTLRDYANMVRVLDRAFGDRTLESITPRELELWIYGYRGSNRTRLKYLICFGSIFKRAAREFGLQQNPADLVDRPRVRRSVRIDVLNPAEVASLVRGARSEQDRAIIQLAALAGLRIGEILALRWRDVDFDRRAIHVRENWTIGETTTPKNGTERTVPMAEALAACLARIRRRDHFTAAEDLVLCSAGGRHLGYKSLKVRYRAALKAASLREDFRFHNLRHTFGSTVIRHADAREVMEWMGHAHLSTTQRYLAFVDHGDAAQRVSDAFGQQNREN